MTSLRHNHLARQLVELLLRSNAGMACEWRAIRGNQRHM